ncbi:helix-turn-helix transcriptional regulator [Mucilaginibacter sp.]
MQLSFNIGDFLMLALVVQGFILAGLLFYSPKKISSNRWLGALVFIVSEATLLMELDYSGIWERYPILQLVIMHFVLAIGPIIYFYTQSLLFNRNKLTTREWLYFLPLLLEMKYQIIYLLYISGFLYIPFIQHIYFLQATQQLLFGGFPLTTSVAFISIIIYVAITYRNILRYEKTTQLPAYKLKDLNWIKKLLYFLSAFIIIWLFSLVTNTMFSKNVLGVWDHYILYIPAIIFVYALGMSAWRRQNNMPETEIAEYIQKPTKIYFSPSETENHIKLLTDLMELKMIYLNPLLKVEDVAALMSISDKALSSFLNQHIGTSFNDFVNQYRVEEAKYRLADPTNRNFTIAAIAFDCGFNSLPTFQRVFKQVAGVTPSKYQNQVLMSQIAIK